MMGRWVGEVVGVVRWWGWWDGGVASWCFDGVVGWPCILPGGRILFGRRCHGLVLVVAPPVGGVDHHLAGSGSAPPSKRTC